MTSGTNFAEDVSVQWSKLTLPTTATGASVFCSFAYDSVPQTNTTSITASGYAKDSKFVLLSERWHPYDI